MALNQPIILLLYDGGVNSLCVSFLHKLIKIEAKELLKKSSSDKSTNINYLKEYKTRIAPNNHLINDEKNSDIVETQQIHITSIYTRFNVDKITGILSRVGIKTIPS